MHPLQNIYLRFRKCLDLDPQNLSFLRKFFQNEIFENFQKIIYQILPERHCFVRLNSMEKVISFSCCAEVKIILKTKTK